MNDNLAYLQKSGLGINPENVFNYKRLGLPIMIFLSLLSAVLLVIFPDKIQLVMIAAVPAFLILITIFTNAYLGVLYFFLYEYLRPVDFIPALRPLRIGLIIELLTLISWLLFVIVNHRKIKWNKFNYFFISLVGVMGVTIITALNNRFAFNATQVIFVYFVIFIISTNVVDTRSKLEKLIWLFLVVNFYHALKGLFNYAVVGFVSAGEHTSGVVGSGFIGDENDFALAINVMIPFAYFYFLYSKKLIKKYFSLIILVIFVLAVISSMSRGGWVGLMGIILYCIMGSKRKIRSLAITVGLALAVFLFAPPEYWTEVNSISDTSEGTARARINYWKAGVAMFVDNPIIGVGAGNGPVRMSEYVHGFRDNATQWGRTFHGTFPQVMAELGGLGLSLYLIMIIYALSLLVRIRKRSYTDKDDTVHIISSAIIGSIIGYILTATFISTAYYPHLWTLFVLTLILYFMPKERANELPFVK
jgi:probable O-glycosylation ligase (exosortase A-associated)